MTLRPCLLLLHHAAVTFLLPSFPALCVLGHWGTLWVGLWLGVGPELTPS